MYGLVPVLAWLVVHGPPASGKPMARLHGIASAILGGVVLAIMVYGGARNCIVPAVLSVAMIVLLHHLSSGWQWRPWVILGAVCCWSIPLSAMKLTPAFEFVSGYPRSYLYLYLFNDPVVLAKALVKAFFIPGRLPALTPTRGAALGLVRAAHPGVGSDCGNVRLGKMGVPADAHSGHQQQHHPHALVLDLHPAVDRHHRCGRCTIRDRSRRKSRV